MESAHRISRLCDGWQARAREANLEDQAQFSREFLKLLGWTEPVPVDLPPAKMGLAYKLRGASSASLMAQFVPPGALEPPGTVVSKGLDHCPGTRAIVSALRHSSVNYVLITDLFRAYLYEIGTDTLLLYADSPDFFNRDMALELSKGAVEAGALEELRRPPRSEIAAQLRRCQDVWTDRIACAPGGSEELAAMVLDRLVLLRYIANEDATGSVNWPMRAKVRQLFDDAPDGHVSDVGTRAGELFRELWQTWQAHLFQPLPQLLALLEMPEIGGAVVRDFALMSARKFEAPVILESFNFGDADEKARVRLVPERDEDREIYLARLTPETINGASIRVDLFEEGYRAIFHWFDQLVEASRRIGLSAPAKVDTSQATGETDMDLFAWSELDAQRDDDTHDEFLHVAENALKVLYNTARQYRTARLMLYVHVLERYRGGQHRFARFPDIESALVRRPVSTERDKRRLFAG